MTSLEDRVDSARAADADQVQAVLATVHGETVLERYYGGQEKDIIWPPAESGETVTLGDWYPVAEHPAQMHNIKSATKSVMATLIGIAVETGALESIDLTVGDLLPDHLRGVDPRKGDISIRHLLAMRSGLRWEENGESTQRWLTAPDLVAFTLRDLPLDTEPGAAWNYSTADSHLLSACLQRATGISTLDFGQKHLFAPVGVVVERWSADPQGITIGGSELFLTPRQMATFGDMIRRRGAVHDAQVVSPEWIDFMLTRQPEVTTELMLAKMQQGGMVWPDDVRPRRSGYANQWWWSDLAGYPAYAALGLGGQLIYVVEELGLVGVEVATASVEPRMEEVPYRETAALSLLELCAAHVAN